MSDIDAGASPISLNMMRFGADAPLPERRPLRAGPLRMILEGGDLRYVRGGGVEIVRRLYMAVRDQNWETIAPRYTSFSIDDRGDSFSVRFTAEHVRGDVDFAWTGEIEGLADGTVACRLSGRARSPFLRNRIGFCVLHPMALAGVPATATTPEGVVEARFPERISPNQPFIDLLAIEHPVGDGGRCRIAFSGDLFEMEDQRNWTDASYKTYSTPLRIPYPVLIEAGTVIEQTVTISVADLADAPDAAAEGPAVAIGDRGQGTLPRIGFGHSSVETDLSEAQAALLGGLRPAHLWAQIDLARNDWETALRAAIGDAGHLDAALQLSAVGVDAAGAGRVADVLRGTSARVDAIFVYPPSRHPVTFPRADLETDGASVRAMNAALAAAGLAIPVGGGSRAYFTEFNRAAERLPIAEMAVATYTLNPQIHAFDNLSIVETLEAQAVTIESAKAIVGRTPLAVGPVTFRPPSNPNATGPEAEVAADALPPAVDPRQLSLLGAGWTVGSIHRLTGAGVDSLTYFETVGWQGLEESEHADAKRGLFPAAPGQLFPLFHVFAALSGWQGADLLPVALADGLATEALALRREGSFLALIANLTDEPRDVTVSLPALTHPTRRFLDETTYAEAASNPSFFVDGEAFGLEGASATMRLLPFAVVCLRGEIGSD